MRSLECLEEAVETVEPAREVCSQPAGLPGGHALIRAIAPLVGVI